MKNICENCQHWREDQKPKLKGLRLGDCTKFQLFYDCTEWKQENGEYYQVLKPEYKNHKAFTQDGSDYRASLETLHDFGCVQFEASAPPNYFPENPEED